jgi:hypothetical protein
VIEEQQVIACSVPISRENYHAPAATTAGVDVLQESLGEAQTGSVASGVLGGRLVMPTGQAP